MINKMDYTNREKIQIWQIIAKNRHLNASEISILTSHIAGLYLILLKTKFNICFLGKRVSNSSLKTFQENIEAFEMLWNKNGKYHRLWSIAY